MNLWLRLFWLLLTAPFRKSVGPFETTKLHKIVLPNDLDIVGHVNNGRYLTLADLGRMDYVFRSGAGRIVWSLRASPAVGDAIGKFRRDLTLFQRYTIETRILGWDEKWFFVEHRFVRRGRVVGVVAARAGWVAAKGLVSTATIVERMGVTDPSPPLPEWVVDWSRGCDGLTNLIRQEEALAGISS